MEMWCGVLTGTLLNGSAKKGKDIIFTTAMRSGELYYFERRCAVA
jgi:hypothetical protein